MKTQTRSQLLGGVHRAVIHIGGSLVAKLPEARIRALAAEVASLRSSGLDVVLVPGGAIQMGLSALNLQRRPGQIPLLRAASAVGQAVQVRACEDALSAHDIAAAQVMLTPNDLIDRARFLHQRHTLMALLDYTVVPIVGESSSPEQSLGGGSEILAARLLRLVEADLMVLLTTAEGLYADSPRRGGEVLHQVEDIDALARRVDQAMTQGVLQQAVAAKVHAARLAAADGVPTVVASGLQPGILSSLLDDDHLGTLILPSRQQRSRKQWISQDLRPAGHVRVNNHTHSSLAHGGRSLFPAGVTEVEGDFSLGQAVRVMDNQGQEFARGLAGYSADELKRLLDNTSADDIAEVLGYKHYEEFIRRDDLIIL